MNSLTKKVNSMSIGRNKNFINIFFLPSLVYILSNSLILFNKGLFWDDWTVYQNSFIGIKQQFLENGTILPAYLHWIVQNLPFPIVIYRAVIFITYLLILILTLKTVRRLNLIPDNLMIIFGCLLAAMPLNSAKIVLAIFHYGLFLLCFIFALFLFTIYENKKYLFLRFIILLLFAVSFLLNSLLVFYFILFLFLFRKEKIINYKSLCNILSRNLDFLLLPFVFWLIKLQFFKIGGLYALENYNQFDSRGLLFLPLGVFRTLQYSFFEMLKRIWETLTGNYFFIILLFALILSRFLQRLAVYEGKQIQVFNRKINDKLFYLCLGLFLFILGALPYIMVEKVPSYNNYDGRHQILLTFGTAFMVLGFVEILINQRLRKYFYAVFISSCIILNFNLLLNYQKNWFRQLSIMEHLKGEPLIRQYYTFLIEDNSDKFCEAVTTYYVYTGMLYNIMGKQDKFAITKDKFEQVIKSYGSIDKLLINKEVFKMKDFKPTNFECVIRISNGSFYPSTINTLQLLFLDFTNKKEFSCKIKKIVNLTVEKL